MQRVPIFACARAYTLVCHFCECQIILSHANYIKSTSSIIMLAAKKRDTAKSVKTLLVTLQSMRGRDVVFTLRNDSVVRGTIIRVDADMNVELQNATVEPDPFYDTNDVASQPIFRNSIPKVRTTNSSQQEEGDNQTPVDSHNALSTLAAAAATRQRADERVTNPANEADTDLIYLQSATSSANRSNASPVAETIKFEPASYCDQQASRSDNREPDAGGRPRRAAWPPPARPWGTAPGRDRCARPAAP